jgi:rSAM/selenodomain-associated transferase 1
MTGTPPEPSRGAGDTNRPATGCDALAVFTKIPVPGRVKTRLARVIGAESAAQLASAFLQDTWVLASSFDGLAPLLVLDGAAEDLQVSPGTALWLQGTGDLGQRLERTFERGLRAFSRLIIIGTDSPGLPREFIQQARSALERHDAVLGPSDDGGYYLIGVRRYVPDMLSDLPWSSPDTFAATNQRLSDLGFSVAHLPAWYDVDVVTDLERLRRDVDANRIAAPATKQVLQRISERELATIAAPSPDGIP